MHSSTQGQPQNYQHKPFPLLRNATKKGLISTYSILSLSSPIPQTRTMRSRLPKKSMFIKLPLNKFKWTDEKK